jgi:hypothetical protein
MSSMSKDTLNLFVSDHRTISEAFRYYTNMLPLQKGQIYF